MKDKHSKLKQHIAWDAASIWSKCSSCNGLVNNKRVCHKPNKACSQWYHAYRGALLALDDDRCVPNYQVKRIEE